MAGRCSRRRSFTSLHGTKNFAELLVPWNGSNRLLLVAIEDVSGVQASSTGPCGVPSRTVFFFAANKSDNLRTPAPLHSPRTGTLTNVPQLAERRRVWVGQESTPPRPRPLLARTISLKAGCRTVGEASALVARDGRLATLPKLKSPGHFLRDRFSVSEGSSPNLI